MKKKKAMLISQSCIIMSHQMETILLFNAKMSFDWIKLLYILKKWLWSYISNNKMHSEANSSVFHSLQYVKDFETCYINKDALYIGSYNKNWCQWWEMCRFLLCPLFCRNRWYIGRQREKLVRPWLLLIRLHHG